MSFLSVRKQNRYHLVSYSGCLNIKAGSGQREPPELNLKWGGLQLSRHGCLQVEVEVPPLQAQVRGVHAVLAQLYVYTSNIFLPASGTNLLAWSVEVLADLLGYCLLSYDFLLSMHLVMTVQYSTVQYSTEQYSTASTIIQVVMVSAGITPLVYLAGAEELAKLVTGGSRRE